AAQDGADGGAGRSLHRLLRCARLRAQLVPGAAHAFSGAQGPAAGGDRYRGPRDSGHPAGVRRRPAGAAATQRVPPLPLVSMDTIVTAFGLIFEPYVLLVILCSAAFGLFVGSIPGLTATMATALLVPVTFFME